MRCSHLNCGHEQVFVVGGGPTGHILLERVTHLRKDTRWTEKAQIFQAKKTTKIQRQNKICPRNEITSRYLIFRWIILQEDRLHLAVDSSASNGSIRRCLCVQMWRRNSRMNSENSAICRCCRSDQLSLFVAAILCRNSPSAVNVMSLVVVEGTRTR